MVLISECIPGIMQLGVFCAFALHVYNLFSAWCLLYTVIDVTQWIWLMRSVLTQFWSNNKLSSSHLPPEIQLVGLLFLYRPFTLLMCSRLNLSGVEFWHIIMPMHTHAHYPSSRLLIKKHSLGLRQYMSCVCWRNSVPKYHAGQ